MSYNANAIGYDPMTDTLIYSIQPRNDYVLIERIENQRSVGLLEIPQIAREKSILGKVLAVGPGKLIEGVNGGLVRKPLEVKAGDIVFFNSKWSDFSPTHEANDQLFNRHLHLVQEADVFLKVTSGRNPD